MIWFNTGRCGFVWHVVNGWEIESAPSKVNKLATDKKTNTGEEKDKSVGEKEKEEGGTNVAKEKEGTKVAKEEEEEVEKGRKVMLFLNVFDFYPETVPIHVAEEPPSHLWR